MAKAPAPKLTPLEIVRERITNFDAEYHDSLYTQCMYALGGEFKHGGSNPSGEGFLFPVYPDVIPKKLKIAESRRILNTQFIGMSRTMFQQPEPMSPQVDKFTAEFRKQVYLHHHRELQWGDQYAACHLDGDNTGVGWCEIGMKNGMVDIEHCPTYNVLWDRLARTPSRSSWVCFVRYISVHAAKARYGEKGIAQVVDLHAASGRSVQCVRKLTYCDTGDITGVPTIYTFLGGPDMEPCQAIENPLGRRLTAFWNTYWTPPGMRKPLGRIPMQQAVQEAINELEAFNRAQLKQPGSTQVDVTQIHPDDAASLLKGRVPSTIRITKPSPTGYPAVVRIPASEFPVAAVQLLPILERQFNADSGTTDAERGSLSAEKRTLGENELVDQRGSTQASWSERQAAAMYQNAISGIFSAMVAYDREPFWVDVDGSNYLANDPDDPRMSLPEIFREPSSVLISEQAIRRVDGERKSLQRVAQLRELMPLVGVPGGVSQAWYTEELLRAIGEMDPEEAMIDLESPMAPEAGAVDAAVPAGIT